MADSHLYSVVIPTFNGSATIARCLSSVFSQDFEKPFEVIVVDSSQDDTPEIIQQRFPDTKLTRLQRQTPEGAARNIGIKKARGDVIVLTDQDCVADSDWLFRIDGALSEGSYDAVGGSVRPSRGDDLFGRVSFLLEFSQFLPNTKAGFRRTVPSCNIAYRRRIFDEGRAFSEVFPVSEDMVFNYSLTQDGHRIFFNPSIRITHINRRGVWRALSHQFYLGAGSSRSRLIEENLPGAFLADWPLFMLPLLFYRWVATLVRLSGHWRGNFSHVTLYAFPILIPLTGWLLGFSKGISAARKAQRFGNDESL